MLGVPMNFLTHLARSLGVLRPATARPWGNAFEEGGSAAHRFHGLPPGAFEREPHTPGSYSEAQCAAVWQKGQPIVGWDPKEWRCDHRGNPLFRGDYGDAGSAFGWEIGHIVERRLGGNDELANLRPQQCRQASADGASGAALNLNPFER